MWSPNLLAPSEIWGLLPLRSNPILELPGPSMISAVSKWLCEFCVSFNSGHSHGVLPVRPPGAGTQSQMGEELVCNEIFLHSFNQFVFLKDKQQQDTGQSLEKGMMDSGHLVKDFKRVQF